MWAGVQVEGWLLSMLAAVLLTWFHYSWLIRDIRRGHSIEKLWLLPLFLRFSALFLLIFLMFGPWLRYAQTQEVKPRLMVYVDSSESLDSIDKKNISALSSKLRLQLSQWDVGVKYFGSNVKSKDAVISEEIGGAAWLKSTNFQSVFQDIQKEKFKYGLESALILSDGIANEGLLPESLKVPNGLILHAVGVGDTVQYPDVFIKSTLLNKEIYLGNSGELEVVVGVRNYSSMVTVGVAIQGYGRVTQSYVPSGSTSVKRLVFNIPPQTLVGLKSVNIAVVGGRSEKNVANNAKLESFQVVDTRKIVGLLGDFVEPDMGAIRRALQGYDPVLAKLSSRGSYEQSGLDALVVMGIPAEFGSVKQSSQKFLQWLNAGKSLLIIPRREYDLEVINAMSSVARLNSDAAWQDAQALVNINYSGFALEDRLKTRWLKFPPLQVPLQKFTMGDKSKVLLWQRWSGMETDIPMQWVESVGKGNLMVCLGSGFWRWGLFEQKNFGDQDGFQQWIRRSLGVLTTGLDANKRLEIVVGEKQLEAGESASMRLIYRDLDGTINNQVSPVLRLLPLEDKKDKSQELGNRSLGVDIGLQKGDQGFEARTFPLKSGVYRLEASAQKGNESFADREMLVVSEISMEKAQITAELDWLRRLSRESGGNFMYWPSRSLENRNNSGDWSVQIDGKAKEVGDALDKSLGAEKVIKEVSRNWYWYEVYGLLLTIAALLGMEWAFRKWLGKY